MNTTYKNAIAFSMLFATGIVLTKCTKAEMDDNVVKGDPPAVAGGYVNSNEIAPADLVAYFPFEGNGTDAKGGVTGGVQTGGSYVPGKKGLAYQGSTTSFIAYANPGPIATLTSFTVSFWINTQKHDGGAQGIFALAKNDGSFWGNFFVIIEGNNSSSNKMQSKLHFEKNVTPSIPNVEHWIDPAARPDDMYGAWRQIVYTYDAATSKASYYANGNPVDLGADAIRKSGNGNELLGPLAFKNPSKFIIGGYQNHLGAPFGGLEPWMLTYTGKLDEMRFWKKALTSEEVTALYQLERQGR
jgi:hypothetical protein